MSGTLALDITSGPCGECQANLIVAVFDLGFYSGNFRHRADTEFVMLEIRRRRRHLAGIQQVRLAFFPLPSPPLMIPRPGTSSSPATAHTPTSATS